MLCHRLRRWHNMNPALVQHIVLVVCIVVKRFPWLDPFPAWRAQPLLPADTFSASRGEEPPPNWTNQINRFP